MQFFNHDNFDPAVAAAPPPRTATVLVLLAVAACVFSYLGAYALMGALVSADVISAWPPGDDPRPRNMLIGFIGLMAFFTLSAGAFRLLSSRQLRRIDAMADEGGS